MPTASDIDILGIAGGIITILTAGLLLKNFILPAFRTIKNLIFTAEEFFIDWSGEEERPGRDAIPGVMERLNRIDGQLTNNGGSSLKDAVDRIEKNVNKIHERLEEGDKEFENIYRILNDLNNYEHSKDNKDS